MRAGHALEFQVGAIAEIIDEPVFERGVERLGVTLVQGLACACEAFPEHLVRLALAHQRGIAVVLAALADGPRDDEVEGEGAEQCYPVPDALIRSLVAGSRYLVDEADVGPE